MNMSYHVIESNKYLEYQSISNEDLVHQCGRDPHPEAWTEFAKRFDQSIAKIIDSVCRKLGGASFDIVDDLIQETYLKLCANNYSLLVNFRLQHANAFWGYIKDVASSVVYDYLRSRHAIKRDAARTVDLGHAMNYVKVGHGRAESLENEILLSEIDDLLLQRGAGLAEEKERKIFWLYYRDGLTAKAIASLPDMGLTVKGVESALLRLTRFVKKSLGFRSE
jgi:RNA polymerase sigma-70 factor (ECF subfamily)